MILVDTTVWIDFFAGRPNAESLWLRSNAGGASIGLTDLTLCEILQGVRSERMFQEVRQHLLGFEMFETGGEALAVAAAENYRALRAQGYTVRKTINCLIATFCIREGHSLLHRDRDFEPFERHLGLRVVRAQE